ncbi:MAG: hypothetical protein K9M80_02015 [Candidatus Marinimicrobia bacterium]|nr:hypothetical protein [Candidatus Neomarinimicrobiota bacterium]
MDIDIIADIQKNHIPHLMEQLKNDYYIDENMIKEAIQHSTSFNIVHLETAMKVDVFIKKNNSYGNRSLERKLKKSLTEDMENTQFNFASPEDIILNKLKWYKIGNKVSERQWLDVLGVIKVQQNSLDIEYMKKWSKQLGIFGLLIKAFKESEIPL